MNPQEPGESDLPLQQRPRDQSEVLLRNRDVQSLSRAFRRMAEVQEALVDHLEQAEQARGRGWVAPVLGLFCLVLGLGLGVYGLSEWEKTRERSPVEVKLGEMPPPSVTVQAPEVTVQVPESPAPAPGITPELFKELIGRIEGMDATRAEDRLLIGELTNRLLESELSNQRLLEQLQVQGDLLVASQSPRTEDGQDSAPAAEERQAVQPTEAVAALGPSADDATTEFSTAELDAIWLGALNGMIALGGSPQYRFQQASRVQGEPHLEDVLFLIWAPDGPAETVIRADKAEFRLQLAAHTLEIHLTDGTRVREGQRTPLPGGGLRVVLPEIETKAWLEHFPELARQALASDAEVQPAEPDAAVAAETSEGEAVTPPVAQPEAALSEQELEQLRLAVDALLSRKLSFGFYRLNKLGGFEDGKLLGVQIAWYEASGRLFKYIEADSMSLHDRGGNWLELRFENGGFRQGENFTPFREQVYRMHLADQDLDAWLATGASIGS